MDGGSEWVRLLLSQDVERNSRLAHLVEGRAFQFHRSSSGKLRCTSAGSRVTLREDGGYISLDLGKDAVKDLENEDGRGQDAERRGDPGSPKEGKAGSDQGFGANSSRAASASSTRPHTPASRLQSRANSAVPKARGGSGKTRGDCRPPLDNVSNRQQRHAVRPRSGLETLVRPMSGLPGLGSASLPPHSNSQAGLRSRPFSAVVSPSKLDRTQTLHNRAVMQQLAHRPSSAMRPLGDSLLSPLGSTMKIGDLSSSPSVYRKVASAGRIGPLRASHEAVRSRSAGSVRQSHQMPEGRAGKKLSSGSKRGSSRSGAGLSQLREESDGEVYDEDGEGLGYVEDLEDSIDGDGVDERDGREEHEGAMQLEGSHEQQVRGASVGPKGVLRPSTASGVRLSAGAVSWGETKSPVRTQSADRLLSNSRSTQGKVLPRAGDRAGPITRAVSTKRTSRPSTALIESFGPASVEEDTAAAASAVIFQRISSRANVSSMLSRRGSSASRTGNSSSLPRTGSASQSSQKAKTIQDDMETIDAEVEAMRKLFDKMLVQESKRVWEFANKIQRIASKELGAQNEVNTTLVYLNSLEDDVLVIDKEIADVETNLHDAKARAFAVSKEISARVADHKKASPLLEQDHTAMKRNVANLGQSLKILEKNEHTVNAFRNGIPDTTDFSSATRDALCAAAEMRALEQRRSAAFSKVTTARKKVEEISYGLARLKDKSASLAEQRSQLKEEIKNVKLSIGQNNLQYIAHKLSDPLREMHEQIKAKMKLSIRTKMALVSQTDELNGSSDDSDRGKEDEDRQVEKPEGWGNVEEGEGWKNSGAVMRKAMLASRAPSPRWALKEFETMTSWACDVARVAAMHKEEERSRVRSEGKVEKATGGRKDAHQGEGAEQTKKPVRLPATQELWSEVAAANYETSYFDELSDQVAQRWKDEFFERMAGEQARAAAGRDMTQIWKARGLPLSMEEDFKKLKGIRAESMQPPEQERLEEFKSALKKACKDFAGFFDGIDADKDGLINVDDFLNGATKLKLDWSPFEVVRIFKYASGNDPIISCEELMTWFAPPEPSRNNIERLMRTFPFLWKEPDETNVKLLLGRMDCISVSSGECIYAVGRIEDWMYIIEDGNVEVVDAHGNVQALMEDQAFGIAQGLTRANSDSYLRRDTAYARSDCLLWKLARTDLDYVLGKSNQLRLNFYNLDDMFAASYRASVDKRYFSSTGALGGKARVSGYRSGEVSMSSDFFSNQAGQAAHTSKRLLQGKWSDYNEQSGPWDSLVVTTSVALGKKVVKVDEEAPNGECSRLANDKVVDFRCSAIDSMKDRLKVAKKAFESRLDRTKALNWRCRRLVAEIV